MPKEYQENHHVASLWDLSQACHHFEELQESVLSVFWSANSYVQPIDLSIPRKKETTSLARILIPSLSKNLIHSKISEADQCASG